MTQTLINFDARARTTDPATSHEAAASTDVCRSHRLVLDALRHATKPLTSAEVLTAIRDAGEKTSDGRVRGALKELCRLGSVVRVDELGVTECGGKCGRYGVG